MKFKVVLILSLLSWGMMSCDSTEEITVETEVLPENNEFITARVEDVCEILIPSYFIEMNDINPNAVLQSGFIEPEDSISIIIADEIYAIVLADYKNDLEKVMGDSIEIDILDFNTMCVQNLSLTLDDLKVEYETPNIQEVNGVKSIHNEFYGRLGEYLVYYQFGIYETEIGYYQVLTWCMQDHLTKHKDEMYKITSSFKEL